MFQFVKYENIIASYKLRLNYIRGALRKICKLFNLNICFILYLVNPFVQ